MLAHDLSAFQECRRSDLGRVSAVSDSDRLERLAVCLILCVSTVGS